MTEQKRMAGVTAKVVKINEKSILCEICGENTYLPISQIIILSTSKEQEGKQLEEGQLYKVYIPAWLAAKKFNAYVKANYSYFEDSILDKFEKRLILVYGVQK